MASAPAWTPPAWAQAPARSGVLFLDRVAEDGTTLSSHAIDTQPAFLLGRMPDCADIHAPHANVSRAHACVAHDAAGELLLVDLGSTHGTRLHGGALLPARRPVGIRPGDRIRLADSRFEFVVRREARSDDDGSGDDDSDDYTAGGVFAAAAAAERGQRGEGASCSGAAAAEEGTGGRVGRVRSRSPSRERGQGTGGGAAQEKDGGGGHLKSKGEGGGGRRKRWEEVEPRQGEPGSASFAAAAVAATQAAAQAQAQALRASHGLPPLGSGHAGGVALPSSFPGAPAADKRKLLWGAHKRAASEGAPAAAPAPAAVPAPAPAPARAASGEAAFGHNRWDQAEFADGEKREKFLKLMGAKKAAAEGDGRGAAPAAAAPAAEVPAAVLSRDGQQRVLGDIEAHFQQGAKSIRDARAWALRAAGPFAASSPPLVGGSEEAKAARTR